MSYYCFFLREMKRLIYLLLFSIASSATSQILVKDIASGTGHSSPTLWGQLKGQLVFSATTAANGNELWISDGTNAGTRMVKDLNSSSHGSIPFTFTSGLLTDSLVYFVAQESQLQQIFSLYRSDGTANGTFRLMEFQTPEYPQKVKFELCALGNRILFVNKMVQGNELWVSDGSVKGTHILKKINPGTGGCDPLNLVSTGSKVFFYANDHTHGHELWCTDGTDSGTYMVKDIFPGSVGSILNVSFGAGMYAFKDKVYFCSIDDLKAGFELFVSDGTDTGTYMLRDLSPQPNQYSSPVVFAACDKFMLMVATNQDGKYCIYRSDGTYAGTYSVYNDTMLLTKSKYVTSVSLHDKIVFPFFSTQHGIELWVSDGTANGTHMVIDISIGQANGALEQFIPYGNKAIFTAANPILGVEAWKTDGTFEGTKLVEEIIPGTTQIGFNSIQIYQGDLYCSLLLDPKIGMELYKIKLGETSLDDRKEPFFKLYPNPCSPGQYVQLNTELESLALFDLHGRKVAQIAHTDSGFLLPEDIGAGVYLIQFMTQGSSTCLRLVVN